MILQNGILHSELLDQYPVVHGFTTRERGDLGFGKRLTDPDATANRKRLFEELQLTGRIHVQPHQVHSNRAIDALQFSPGCEADASYTIGRWHLLSILTADCLPILIYHPDGLVGAIHAGWRGLLHGIIPKTLAKLPPHPIVAVGPAIGACCYEVSADLASDFEKEFGSEVVDSKKEKPHLDLIRVAMLQLQEAGVDEMDVAHLCTYCHRELFFSFRREGPMGRLMSFIGLR